MIMLSRCTHACVRGRVLGNLADHLLGTCLISSHNTVLEYNLQLTNAFSPSKLATAKLTECSDDGFSKKLSLRMPPCTSSVKKCGGPAAAAGFDFVWQASDSGRKHLLDLVYISGAG